uniref:Uncharacterized protein n=1 Tax=Rhizophora mucronata TaxID=61149 RepID=A0A2P2R4X5_RHIMU
MWCVQVDSHTIRV